MNALLLFAAITASSFPQSGTVALRVALHVHTTFSDGSHTVEEIARRAREESIDAVLLADHFLTRLEYGPPLFRKALAVSVNPHSLGSRDLDGYLQAAREAERETGVMVLPGVEITPFYYWEGSLLAGDLTLHSAHRHLLVFFPENADLAGLGRVLSAMSAPGALQFRVGSLLLVWPLLLALWSANRLRRHRGRSLPSTLVLSLVAVAGVVALVRAWPYLVPKHSPYAGDAGTSPYQDALDASLSTSALTFWAHPETSSDFRHPRYPVAYRSEEYPDLVATTRGATGFASLYEGDRRAAAFDGPWDRTLREFTRGERSLPVWTVGELDLHREGEAGGKFLGEVETIVFASERSHQGVLDALARGSMYAVRQTEGSHLRLDDFRVTCRGEDVLMGEWTRSTGPCRIHARLRAQGEALAGVTVSLVRNGEVMDSGDVDLDENGVELEWDDPIRDEPAFYRLVARRGNRVALYGNPAFAGVKEAAP